MAAAPESWVDSAPADRSTVARSAALAWLRPAAWRGLVEPVVAAPESWFILGLLIAQRSRGRRRWPGFWRRRSAGWRSRRWLPRNRGLILHWPIAQRSRGLRRWPGFGLAAWRGLVEPVVAAPESWVDSAPADRSTVARFAALALEWPEPLASVVAQLDREPAD